MVYKSKCFTCNTELVLSLLLAKGHGVTTAYQLTVNMSVQLKKTTKSLYSNIPMNIESLFSTNS